MTLAEPGDGKPDLPPEELAEAVGLAFAFVNRGGALLSGMSGRGFLIRKARRRSRLRPVPALIDVHLHGACIPSIHGNTYRMHGDFREPEAECHG